MHKMENCKVNDDCTTIRKNESIAAYKQYSKTANHTLTKFTNDMSEILRHSIERLDNISLKVRNCVYELENQKYTAKKIQVEDKSDEDDPLLAVIEYKPKESNLLNEAVEASKDAQEAVKKAQKVFNSNAIQTKSKEKKTESTISFYTTSSKRDNFTSVDGSMKKERSVMQKIRESYKKLRAKSLTAAEKASCEEQLRLLRREFATQKRRRWLNSKKQRELMVKKGQQVAECYGNERFNDFHWFGPKISVESDGRLTSTSSKKLPSPKNTKLTRKFARENFHEPKGKPQDVKSIRMVTERNDEPVNVIMHTQKQPRYELKQNSPFAASSILDDVTLKDLEPLNAEYPRKDNIFQVDPEVEESLLYKLVNDDVKALELLINVNAQLSHKSGRKQRHKRRNLSRPIRSSRFAIDDIPEEEDPKQVQSEALDVQKTNIIELNDYRSYRNLATKEGRKRLKKYMLDPPKIKRSYIVMPVLVQFDKDISPHLPNNLFKASSTQLKEVERKQKCIFTDATKPGDFLKPYIFNMDSNPKKNNTEPATIMTLTIPNEIPRNVVETIKGRKMSIDVGQSSKMSKPEDNGKGTMLVQKMMSYERTSKKSTSPRATVNGKKSDNQQLISFIVNPDKANVVDPMFPGPSPRKKSSPKKTKPKTVPIANDEQRKSTPTMKAINKLEKEVNSSKIDMELTSTTTTTVASHLQSDQEVDEKVHTKHKKRDPIASTQISSKHSIPPKSTPKSTSLNLLETKSAAKQHHHHHEEPKKKAADEVAKRILSKWQSLENPSIGDLDNKAKDEEEHKNKNYTFIKNPAIVDYENAKNKTSDSKQYRHFSKELIVNASSKEKIHKRQEFHYEYKRKGPDVEIRKVEDEEEEKRKDDKGWNNRNLEQFVTQHKAERRKKTEYEIKPQEPKIKLEPKSSKKKMEKVKSIRGIDKLSYALPERPQTAGQVLDAKGMRNDVGLWLEVKKTPKALTDNKAVDVKVSRRFKRDAEVATSLLEIAEESIDKLAAKKNIEDLEKQLGEETKKFCLEMDQVIKQIQDIPPVVKQQQQAEDLIEMLDVCKTKYAAISHSIKHVATIKGVVSVRSFAQYFGPTCDMKRQWSASELVLTGVAEMKNEEVITHTVETVTFPNLQSIAYRDIASTEPLNGNFVFRLGEAQGNRRDDVVSCRGSTLTRDDLKHLWFLICVYAVIFVLIFSGLNLKLGCT